MRLAQTISDSTMTSPQRCQQLCARTSGCHYFSYELEDQGSAYEDADHVYRQVHKCYLKDKFRLSDVPEGLGINACNEFEVWEEGDVYMHDRDPNWKGASGPAQCGFFTVEAVGSGTLMRVPGYANSVLAIATSSARRYGNGALSLFDAKTLDFLACVDTRPNPESLESNELGHIVVLNEGAGRMSDRVDLASSLQFCTSRWSSGLQQMALRCVTHTPGPDTFVGGAWPNVVEARRRDIRLFGPGGNSISNNLEPEAGSFTPDNKYFFASMQENNAYMIFDVAARKFVTIHGYGYSEMEMDASDRDYKINIKNTWGTDGTKIYGMYQPDGVVSFMADGDYFFLTAKDGAARDADDTFIGGAGPFDGERFRVGALHDHCDCAGCCSTVELGRLWTTAYQPALRLRAQRVRYQRVQRERARPRDSGRL